MKLIKCGHCGRPFYDENEACPYCGHALASSLQKLEKNSNTEAEIAKKENSNGFNNKENKTEGDIIKDDNTDNKFVKSGELPAERQSENTKPTAEEDANSQNKDTVISENNIANRRADTIAAITSTASEIYNEDVDIADPNQTETDLPPRKRHIWIWILIILIAALAALAYIYRDHVKQILASILS